MKKNDRNLPVLVMFQDEARFGRLSLPQRCWAPTPLRPVVVQGVVRLTAKSEVPHSWRFHWPLDWHFAWPRSQFVWRCGL